jgi:hypothetical protein
MPWSTELLAAGRVSPENQQRNFLCGPYHAARVLREAGFYRWEDEPLDQDRVALHAGTALPEQAVGPEVPPGAVDLREYRFELPRVEAARSGTSAPGLAGAIEELSGGELVCVPVSGEWSADAVVGLLSGVADLEVRLIANLRTGPLWGSRPPVELLLRALDGAADLVHGPAPDWDVGHFVELVQLLRGRAGALVLVRDSYPSLGWGGFYLQPPTALAQALLRGDGREGGVLVVGPAEAAAGVERLVTELGLAAKMWDN